MGARKEGAIRSAMADETHKNMSPFSPSFRFVRFADHSNPSPTPSNHFELDECDVFWPPDVHFDASSGGRGSSIANRSFVGDDDSGHRRSPFLQGRFGLSAALAEDGATPVQKRRQAINVPAGRAAAAAAAETSKMIHQSAPVNVPAWPRGLQKPVGSLIEVDEGEEVDGAVDEMVPPHLIVARSRGMSFSVFEGLGRTLKGRDLRRVRNAVFQKTGFLD